MASFSTSYMPAGSWMEENQLHQVAQDHSISIEIDSSSGRRSSGVSSSSGPSFSPDSSVIQYSRPCTPWKDAVEYNGDLSHFRCGPVTPPPTRLDFIPHLSPYVAQQEVYPGIDVNSAKWHAFQCFPQNGPESFKSDTTTSRRSHGSFVSDTSSFSSPESVGGYSDDDIQRVLWNIDDLSAAVGSGGVTNHVSTLLADSIGSTVWDDNEFFRQTPEYTVNPSETVTSMRDSFSDSETQLSNITFAPLVDSSIIDVSGSSFIKSTLEEGGQVIDVSRPTNRRSKRRTTPPNPRSNAVSKPREGSGHASKTRTRWLNKSSSRCEIPICPRATIPCSWIGCTSRFTRQEHLTRHHKIHTGERDYICALAKAGGDDWHKLRKRPENENYSRADNQRDHYLTHLKGGGRNKCAERMFLYWCIHKYEAERAVELLEKMETTRKRRQLDMGPAELDLQVTHPDWPEYLAWREAGGSLESLLFKEEEEDTETIDWALA